MSALPESHDFYDDGYEDDDESLNNRIVFSQDKFYGRQDELEILHGLYNRLFIQGTVTSSRKALLVAESPVAIISGYSGTGKSALVYRFIDELEGQVQPFFFLAGKYEDFQRTDPFSAIVDAFSGFCKFLLQDSEKKSKERVRDAVTKALGSDVNALITLIPDLKEIIGTAEGEALSGAATNASENAWNRLKYLFRTLLKAICDEERPIVLFLDDLQWADSASLGLIGALLQDKSLRHFMFIGSIRANEVDKEHPLNKHVESIESTGKKVERIDLLNLSFDDIGVFVADTLCLDVEETRPLTEALYGKTRGNIFFSMQALEELQRANVLYYSLITFRWEWNLDGLKLETGLSDNVIDAVVAKIQSAPEKLQKALVVAAYTRSSVNIETLGILIWQMAAS
jgi:predicted ATPase